MVHSILLIGQSNMAGRGKASEVEPIEDSRLFVLRNGRWRPMYVPVNPDRKASGINLAESFALRYAEDKNVDVGIIACADGGSCLDQWVPGSLLYDHAVYQTRLAQRTSTVAAVLWHQGESDCLPDRYPVYEEKLGRILDSFRRDLNLGDVPFLLGGLGDYLLDCPRPDEHLENYVHVNAALASLARQKKMTGFVPATGLSSNPDLLHFSAAALRAFGERYYESFLKLEDPNKVFEEKSTMDAAIRSTIELL